ncbi:T9SS type A sorting domain-containing protein [Hymenobacter sp. BT635]|uniref:T9SS type A sorting domain-containing protein n=1 Tax=Hymenobacter nitidus TaxID=2880929 RepID=A0ABS8AE75_9BACT|nr:T9SS type A sorting domain-containing protein [Hymenobacter nitidus]MCB2378698.1 T9SS type A sorting domain-containing protein [Hymenobacter nitidus]
MKQRLPFILLWLLLWGSTPQSSAQSLDAGFAAPSLFQTAIITAAAQQPDGKYIISGNIVRANGTATTAIVRLNNDGTLDPGFVSNSSTSAAKLEVLPGGQILAFSVGLLSINGQNYPNLVKLNTDGSVASGFSTGSGAAGGSVRSMVLQPDGKIVLAGGFTSFNGTPTPGLVRLNPNGSVDQAFTTAMGTGITGGEAYVVAQEPSGKLLVGGSYTSFDGKSAGKLTRLLSSGAYDPTFIPPASSVGGVTAIGIDPTTGQALVQGVFRELARLNPDGSMDASFQVVSPSYCASTSDYGNTRILVDRNRRVLLARSCVTTGTIAPGNQYLTRYLENGDLDPQLNGQGLLNSLVNVVVPQDNGGVLLGGSFTRFGTLTNTSLVRLNASLQVETAFRPILDTYGSVVKVLQQPDGKLLVAGSFREVNGQAATGLMRLNLDGTPDATFGFPAVDGPIGTIALQPNGRLVVAGSFTTVAGTSSPGLARLLANGNLDTSFTSYAAAGLSVLSVGVQPDGGLLVGAGGSGATFNGRTAFLHRLLPSGLPDAGYAQATGTGPSSAVTNIAVLPDGRHYVGGTFTRMNTTPTESVVRLLSTGALDPSFLLPTAAGTPRSITKLLPLANDELLVAGSFASYAGVARTNLVWLNANGSVNTGLNANLGGGVVSELSLQPNGRILVGTSISQLIGSANQGTLFRLNADASLDNSFAAGPALVSRGIRSILVHADGKITIGGSFSAVSGQPRTGIARLTAPNVLSVGSRQSTARTEAWPNPAHDALQLQLAAEARPRTVQLLDNLGRVVLRQPVTQARLTLPLQQLRAGLYVLRVEYADGPVTRRIVVE